MTNKNYEAPAITPDNLFHAIRNGAFKSRQGNLKAVLGFFEDRELVYSTVTTQGGDLLDYLKQKDCFADVVVNLGNEGFDKITNLLLQVAETMREFNLLGSMTKQLTEFEEDGGDSLAATFLQQAMLSSDALAAHLLAKRLLPNYEDRTIETERQIRAAHALAESTATGTMLEKFAETKESKMIANIPDPEVATDLVHAALERIGLVEEIADEFLAGQGEHAEKDCDCDICANRKEVLDSIDPRLNKLLSGASPETLYPTEKEFLAAIAALESSGLAKVMVVTKEGDEDFKEQDFSSFVKGGEAKEPNVEDFVGKRNPNTTWGWNSPDKPTKH